MPMAGGASGGGGSKAGDIRAGGAFVEISAKDSLTKTLAGLKARVMAFAGGLKMAGVGALAAGGVLAAPLAGLFKGGVDRAEEISKLATELGFTVEQMQQLKYAADVAGVSIDDVLKDPGKFKALMDSAPLMDPNEIKAAVQANQELRKTFISLQGAMLPLLQTLGPIIKGVGEFSRRNSGLLLSAAGVAAAFIAVGGGLFLAGSAMSGLIAIGGAVATVLGAISLKVAIVLAVVAGLGVGLGYLATVAFPQTWKSAKQFFGDLLGIAGETIGGIVAAISKGDLEQAWNVALAGLNALWKTLVANMTYVWVSFKATIVDTFREALNEARKLMLDFEAWVSRNDPTGLFGGGRTDAEINAERDRLKGELDGQLGAKMKEADEFRKKQIADAQAEVAAARAVLGAEVDKAKEQVKGESTSGGMLPLIQSARGAFRIADAGQQFGGNGNPVVKELKKANDKADEVIAIQNRIAAALGITK